jgi:ABC-type transport system involved in cytochrome c biogenesis permease component
MLLPIAIRELRVSARNKATHRLRLYFAVGAVAVGGGIGLLFSMGGGLAGSQAGIWIFGALKWIAFVFACAAGVFLTADCLSEEKREGTLGLLFLTDLRGHDVVLGKLLATSLRTFYSLLAIFPVMALSFVLGGVAAEDFQHSLLSLCNTLFFSLALGMAVSAMSRDPHKAMTAALAAMAVFLFVIRRHAANCIALSVVCHHAHGFLSRRRLLVEHDRGECCGLVVSGHCQLADAENVARKKCSLWPWKRMANSPVWRRGRPLRRPKIGGGKPGLLDYFAGSVDLDAGAPGAASRFRSSRVKPGVAFSTPGAGGSRPRNDRDGREHHDNH